MTARLRPLQPDDVAEAARSSVLTFVELDRRLGLPAPEYDDAVRRRQEARVAHLQSTDPDSAWVAEDDGRVVGTALALRRGPLWFLSLLTVDPGHQGRGVGRQLLEASLRTAEDAPAAWILSSPDPRALRRYARAGFALHPGYDATGTVDRAALPADARVREGDVGRHGELVDGVVSALRGAPYGPDLAAFDRAGADLLVAEDGADRGFAVCSPTRVVALGATSPALATRLLWAALARTEGEVELGFLTADQQWATDVVVAAGLTVRPGSSSCRRGALGPLTPFLPSGAYG